MILSEKMRQILNILRYSSTPIPLLQDLSRIRRGDYVAECKGIEFELDAHCHEWYAVLENVINEDYFRHGVAVGPGDTVIDVGAGFGSFALLAARKVGPDGQIIAYEPDPDLCARAQRNAARNGLSNVHLNNEAVGGADGEVDLLLQPHSHRNTMFGCVDGRNTRTDRSMRVRARSILSVIDEIDRPIRLLKLHCEGAEYEILNRIDPERCKRVDQIVLEVHQIDGHTEEELVDRLLYLNFYPVYSPPMIFASRKLAGAQFSDGAGAASKARIAR